MDTKGSRFTVLRLVPAGIIAVGFAAFFVLDLHDYVNIDSLRAHREDLQGWVGEQGVRAGLAFLGLYALAIALALPIGVYLTITGGFLFGSFAASVIVVIAATVGASVLFLAARFAFANLLKARAGPVLERMEAGFNKNAWTYLLVLRLVPIFPFWAVNLAPAFLGVTLWTFISATFIGIIPGTVIYALVGNGLGELLDAGGTPNLKTIFEPYILAPLVGLAVLVMIPIFYTMWKTRGA